MRLGVLPGYGGVIASIGGSNPPLSATSDQPPAIAGRSARPVGSPGHRGGPVPRIWRDSLPVRQEAVPRRRPRFARPTTPRAFYRDDVPEKGAKAMLNGLMMDDFQLSLTVLVERAERLNSGSAVVSRRPDGSVRRTNLGECAQRARRLASGLADLGVGEGD